MKEIGKPILFIVLVLPTVAFAQEAAGILDLSWMDKLGAWLSENLGKSTVIVALLYELLGRSKKTQKALGVLHSIAAIARKLGEILTEIAEWSDEWLPQRKPDGK